MGDAKLTDREQEILRWISEGKTNVEIGMILDISPSTVKKHVEHIFAKLDVTNRTAAAMRGSAAGKHRPSSPRQKA